MRGSRASRAAGCRAFAARGAIAAALTILLAATNVLAAVGGAPALNGVASRKVHAAAGPFDLPLALTLTDPSSEPRIDASSTIVFTFDKPVISGIAVVTEGTATAGTPSFSGNQMVVPLSGIADRQYMTLAVMGVAAADGGTGGTGSVRIGFLMGDVNQNRAVTVSDLLLVNSQLTQVLAAANYKQDVNASGTLSVADMVAVNVQITKALPAPPAPANQPPAVKAGANQTITLPGGANLSGRATDDGLPYPPGHLALAWSQVSGPGTADFSNPNDFETLAIFTAPGYYVLRFAADDGALKNFAQVTIAAASPNANRMLLTMTGLAAPIEVLSFRVGVSSTTIGSGGGAGKSTIQDATFESAESSATPLQLLWLATSARGATAKLQVLDPVFATPVSDWTFSEFFVSSVRVGGAGGDEPLSSQTTISFSRIAYQIYAANGTVAKRSCWDLNENTAC